MLIFHCGYQGHPAGMHASTWAVRQIHKWSGNRGTGRWQCVLALLSYFRHLKLQRGVERPSDTAWLSDGTANKTQVCWLKQSNALEEVIPSYSCTATGSLLPVLCKKEISESPWMLLWDVSSKLSRCWIGKLNIRSCQDEDWGGKGEYQTRCQTFWCSRLLEQCAPRPRSDGGRESQRV